MIKTTEVMVPKTTTVCDICGTDRENIISSRYGYFKCAICGKDCCERCTKHLDIDLENISVILKNSFVDYRSLETTVCVECEPKYDRIRLDVKPSVITFVIREEMK